jgi:amidase
MFRPAGELAALVRDGRASATELAEIALRRIEALDGELGAFVEVDGERALAQAARVPAGLAAPLAGVPIAVKGNTAADGYGLEMGCRALAGNRTNNEAHLVRRLREAGAVIVGITKLPEFGILPTSEPRHGGPARNPWDPSVTPGGSSGGSAAAVAAGMVPLAHGNDGAGSIRIPAACCGLFGLKPSRGRVSRGPALGDSFLSVDGVLSRTVADTALSLDVLAGYEVGDSTWVPRPVESFSHTMRRTPGNLRIAVSAANPLGIEVDPENLRALREGAELLAALGHEVEEATPPLPGEEAMGQFLAVFAAPIGLSMSYARAVAGRDLDEGDAEPLSGAFDELSAGVNATQYLLLITQLQAISRRFIAFFADYDLLLMPTLASRPVPIGHIHGWLDEPMEAMQRSAAFTPFTALLNATGQPAASVPMGFGEDGLPSAVQLIGPPLGEDTLLQVSAQLETARPWAQERPKPTLAAA